MTSIVVVRRIPAPGEIGCIGACPACTVTGKHYPPCLACRDELRRRLSDMQTTYYMARAMN